jgi:hypothetical protein
MRLYAVASAFIIFLALVVSSPSTSKLVRRRSEIIVDACRYVNNATYQFSSRADEFLPSNTNSSDINLLDKLTALIQGSDYLLTTLKKNGNDVRKGQGAVTENDTVEVVKLRNTYYKELPVLTSNLMKIADFYSLEAYAKDSASSFLSRTMSHDRESSAFAEVVIETLSETNKPTLIDLEIKGKKHFQRLIDHIQKPGRSKPQGQTASSTAPERSSIPSCPSSNTVASNFTFCTD